MDTPRLVPAVARQDRYVMHSSNLPADASCSIVLCTIMAPVRHGRAGNAAAPIRVVAATLIPQHGAWEQREIREEMNRLRDMMDK